MIVKAADVWTGIRQRKLLGAIIPGSRCLAGAIVYVGVVTSHVTKMAVTPLDSPWSKPPVARTNHGAVFYTSEVIAD